MPDQAAVHGPIDFVLSEFPEEADTKACADAVMDLVERDIIRLYDVLVIRKALDGSYSGIEPGGGGAADAGEGGVGKYRP